MKKELILFSWEDVHGGAVSPLAISYRSVRMISGFRKVDGRESCDAVARSIRVGLESRTRRDDSSRYTIVFLFGLVFHSVGAWVLTRETQSSTLTSSVHGRRSPRVVQTVLTASVVELVFADSHVEGPLSGRSFCLSAMTVIP